MVTLTERTIMKSRSGVYSDTAENRRKHRVGQKYGAEKQPEDGEKTEKKETDPAKELEAVNKVIAAINEGKLNLPAAEVMKLSEKKQKLEAAKNQTEKINAGVKANEEKKNAEEAKETSKKINEAQKEEEKKTPTSVKIEQKTFRIKDGKISASMYDTQSRISKVTKYAKENGLEVEWLESKKEASEQASEADKEDLREARKKLAYLQDNEERLIKRDGKERYEERLKQAKDEVAELKGEKPKESQKSEYFDRTGYKPIYRMNEEEADKFISDAKKYLSENKDAKDVEQVQDAIRKVELRKEEIKETSNEEAEVYTRIKFEDVPNSGKINLKKYLSEKVRKGVDEKWSNIKNIPTENLKKMEKGLVNDLNKNFEAIKKSQRAELLYSIMKVKGELEKRGKESQKKE